MRRALLLAARGRGTTSPNPMVGASVVASDGAILGDGWHQRAGEPHAEVHALRAAGERARGATLICTLEPCAHHGRTGPCVEQIVAAGIERVVVATADPNPMVAGQGIRYLAERGIEVISGVEAAAAARLNVAFFTTMRHRRPWVVLKAGVSVDGRMAAARGERTAITSAASQARVQRLRAEVDAVGVGSETLLIDDPLLTARDVFRARPLTRVVFDRRLRTPVNARMLSTLDAGPVVVVTSESGAGANPSALQGLQNAGADVLVAANGIGAGIARLADVGVQSLLLEGGPALHRAAWDAGMIDEVQVFIAPHALGPSGTPMIGADTFSLAGLSTVTTEAVGDDVLVRGYVHRPD